MHTNALDLYARIYLYGTYFKCLLPPSTSPFFLPLDPNIRSVRTSCGSPKNLLQAQTQPPTLEPQLLHNITGGQWRTNTNTINNSLNEDKLCHRPPSIHLFYTDLLCTFVDQTLTICCCKILASPFRSIPIRFAFSFSSDPFCNAVVAKAKRSPLKEQSRIAAACAHVSPLS